MKTKCDLCGTESADEQWEMDDNFDLVCPACCETIPTHFTLGEMKHTGTVSKRLEIPDSMNIQQIKRNKMSITGTPMNGDLIEFRGKACEVSIQGYEGTYKYIGEDYINCAVSDHGFVKYNGVDYRCVWTKKARILKRKYPELFPNEKWT
jgi:hypothetical protein